MNRKRLLYLLFVFAAGIIVTTISFATWEIRHLDNNSAQAESSVYEVQYHYGTSTQKVSSLELTSGFDLLEFAPTVDDLANERYEFLGWKIGTSTEMTSASYATIFTNSIAHTPQDLLSQYDNKPEDNVIHLWECWSNQIPSDKVLLTITYDTNKLHYQLVNASNKFYLFNVNIPNYKANGFIYNEVELMLGDSINIISYGGQKVSLTAK